MKIYSFAAVTFLLTLLLQLPISAQITFEVCDVELAEELLPERSYQEIMENLMVTKMNSFNDINSIDFSQPEPSKRKLLAFPQRSESLVITHENPFASAVRAAYAQHRPLAISPDMIWMLICQGFATHVDQNSEALRAHFVAHTGKKNINIEREYYLPNSVGYWENVLVSFSDSIKNHVGEKFHGLATNRFSTTTSVESTAFEVTLMDAMSSYFSYSMSVTCGIPSITLEGTVEDWEKIERDFAQLAVYDLEWWAGDMKPILHQFTQAAKGKADRDFWQRIYDYQYFEVSAMCGGPSGVITGWMMKLYPYLHNNERNPLIGKDMSDFFMVSRKDNERIKPNQYKGPIIALSELPLGLSKADFTLDHNGKVSEMEFLAGFVGMSQEAETKTLRPEINWGVVDSGRDLSVE